MIAYEYITPGIAMTRYPVIYHDAEQPDKAHKYLVLHEVKDRWNNNWAAGDQWKKYRGVVTWNPLVYADNKANYNMIYCRQFMNIFAERTETYVPFLQRQFDLCAIYGKPASIDTSIMCGRYDVPIALAGLGLWFNAYGVIPDRERPEYRPQWATFFRGGVPSHRKRDALIQHRWSMAFENSRDPYYASGWVTEKIYDCLGSGTIPIYWGAPNITDHVPAEVFIDYRNFSNVNDLNAYLTKTPPSVFDRMSREGLEFFDTVRFDEYLDVFASLP